MADPSSQASALAVRVAFAGHRSLDLSTLEEPLTAAFALVADVAAFSGIQTVAPHQSETIAEAYAALWPDRHPGPSLDLLVGYAPGADRVAAQLWRRHGHGGIHACFPFADAMQPERIAWTDGPGCTDGSLQVALDRPDGLDRPFEAVTVLDGEASGREVPRRDGHLEQARWLVRWADILIVAWNGELAGGTGGTADIVALALRKAIPVVWIDITTPEIATRLLSADQVWLDHGFSELVDALKDADRRVNIAPVATPQMLTALLVPVLGPPSAKAQIGTRGHAEAVDEETAARRDYAGPDPLAPSPRTGWADTPRYVLDCLLFAATQSLAAAWARFYRGLGSSTRKDDPAELAQAAPAEAHPLIEAAFREADRKASFYGDLHRAMQALLLIIAVLAVTVATIPAIAPKAKFFMVAIELGLLGCAYFARQLSFFATSHQRWSDIRRLAERLRALRATWPLGFDIGDDRALPMRSWTEWLARATLRAAGPPRHLAADRQSMAITAARLDPIGIVRGQREYNAATTIRMHRLHDALHRVETTAFWTLIAALATFLPLYWVYLADVPDDHSAAATAKHVIGGLVLMLSAIIPTIAAACLAIDAKLGIEENARRSAKLAEDFREIERAVAETTSVAQAHELMRSAAQLLTTDIDGWRDAAVRRRIAML